MSLEKNIALAEQVEQMIEYANMRLLQHATLKKCGVLSSISKDVLTEVEDKYKELLQTEDDGEYVLVAKGLIEAFLKEWSIIEMGE